MLKIKHCNIVELYDAFMGEVSNFVVPQSVSYLDVSNIKIIRKKIKHIYIWF